jgi:hypothetical protein
MELWEAIEVYAGREIDFVNEVILEDRGTGNLLINWNIVEIPAPTTEDLAPLLAQEPLIKIKYDIYGFIWNITKGIVDMVEESGYTILTLNHPTISVFMNRTYKYPLYRYMDGVIHEIIDPAEYYVSDELRYKYMIKLQDDVHQMILTHTNDELKAHYDTSPQYMKDAIFRGIQTYWSEKVPQWNYNIALETVLRILLEKICIEEIDNRPMTEDESASYYSLLSTVRQCNTMLKDCPSTPGPNLSTTSWYHGFMAMMSNSCSLLRQYEYNQRSYVCGTEEP